MGLSPELHCFFLYKLNSLFCLILGTCWMADVVYLSMGMCLWLKKLFGSIRVVGFFFLG